MREDIGVGREAADIGLDRLCVEEHENPFAAKCLYASDRVCDGPSGGTV